MERVHELVNNARELISKYRPFNGGADDEHKEQPSPAQSMLTDVVPLDENTYPENPKFDNRFNGGTIYMTMRPASLQGTFASWQAEMEFYVKDVDSLMMNGLHWSEANVQKADGCILVPSDNMPSLPKSLGWLFGRRYLLADLGDDPEWRATLWIYGRSCAELREMKLDVLSVDLVRRANAISSGIEVYKYDWAREEGYNTNELYGHMPLEGWWPWPKEDPLQPGEFDDAASVDDTSSDGAAIEDDTSSNVAAIVNDTSSNVAVL
ncbi:unnamed protein product [Clonostachys byssicola]|uniref:Uncharacterized protein n=1 Tax=Clonostachys byssicola TaxID=160290 RepID=A0A9N9YCR6_9HYPO|nr:unnamed protein product [Clonostachys byssicola]